MTSSLTAPLRYSQPTRPYILTTYLSLPELYPQVNKEIGPLSYRNFGLALAHTFRCIAPRWCLGLPGWRHDGHRAIDMAYAADATTLAGAVFFFYCTGIPWIVPADETALAHTEETLARAERSGDDLALNLARCARAAVLLHKE